MLSVSDLGDIAAKIGLHVFPCDANKRPCIKGGFTSATNDRAEIKRIFAAPSAKLIAIPTGRINNLAVIDVDIKNGARGMEWLNLNSEALPQTRTHKTRSGGLHLLFQMPVEHEIRNSAGRVAPGVDVRAEGGYIIIPPSEGYVVADPIAPAEMPRWLIRACLQPEYTPQQAVPHDPITEGGTKYGLAALDYECSAVSSAPFGEQETTLNSAGLKIGALVAGGQIAEAVARSALITAGGRMSSAAGERPWTPKEIEEKVIRAMRDGAASPRRPKDLPERPRAHHQQQTHEQQQEPPKEEAHGDPQPHILKYFTFEDAKPNIDAKDFVEGLLIEAAMSVIYGESNAGKTFWTTDLALHVAAGMEWCGREVEQGAVLYLALEGAHGISNRIAAFKMEHGLEDSVFPLAVVPVQVNLLDPEADAIAVVNTIKFLANKFEAKIKLTVIDTLFRALAGGNENSSEDMGALVKTGDMIRETTGSHVCWIHHSGKDTAKGARGHSSLRAATDTEIEITVEGTGRRAEVRKQRDLEGGDAFAFTLKQVVLGKNRRGKDVTSCVVETSTNAQAASAAPDRRRTLTSTSRRALDVLSDLIGASGEPGHGAPPGCVSVPEKWWRERFYESAMAGAEAKTKQQAFRRAADLLVERFFVGMRSQRVWIVRTERNSSDNYGAGSDA